MNAFTIRIIKFYHKPIIIIENQTHRNKIIIMINRDNHSIFIFVCVSFVAIFLIRYFNSLFVKHNRIFFLYTAHDVLNYVKVVSTNAEYHPCTDYLYYMWWVKLWLLSYRIWGGDL